MSAGAHATSAPGPVYAVRDRALAVVLAAVAALALWGVRDLDLTADNGVPGPAFIPTVLAIGLLVAAAWIAIPNRSRGGVTAVELRGAGAYLTLLIGAAIVFTTLGALLTVTLYVLVELRLLHGRSWLGSAFAGLGVGVAVWFIFVFALDVRMPLGPLAGALG